MTPSSPRKAGAFPWVRCAVFVLLLALSGGRRTPRLAAQTSPDDGRRVEGSLEASLSATALAGQVAPLWGLGAGVWIGRRLFVGGEGFSLPTPIDLTGGASDPERLTFGYGGLHLRVRLWERLGQDVDFGVLMGAGQARLTDARIGIETGSDNVVVLEPTLRGRRTVAGGRVHVGLRLGYRQTLGVEDLGIVESRDLGGLSGTLSVSLERR